MGVPKTPDNPVWFTIKDPKETKKPNPTEWEPYPKLEGYHQFQARPLNITELRTPESVHFWTSKSVSADKLRATGAWNADYLVDLRGGSLGSQCECVTAMGASFPPSKMLTPVATRG